MNARATAAWILISTALALALATGPLATREACAAWLETDVPGYHVYCWNSLSNPKFRYNQTNHQWWHYASYGANWYAISATERPSTFVGNGGWHDLGNGFTYQYTTAYDVGYFKDGTAYRFRYKYAPGLWENSADALSWQTLGASGHNAAFVGNGSWWDLGNGFTYQYSTTYDVGYFKDAGNYRFRYKYAPGLWENSANALSWQALGGAGRNAAFLGSGAWCNLGNGFTYQYTTTYDVGYFKDGASYRYRFKYAPGQWEHTANTLSWQVLGSAGRSASFIGDGTYHDQGNGWWYQGLISNHRAYWSRGDEDLGDRFRYDYTTGQWAHKGVHEYFNDLGAAGRSAAFVGTGVFKALGDGFWFMYFLGSDDAYWSRDGTDAATRFHYWYDTGQWAHRGAIGDWHNLGAGERSSSFIGTDVFKALGDGYSFKYLFPGDEGYWSRDGTEAGTRFFYRYTAGWWETIGPHGPYYHIGGPIPKSAEFIGDGGYYDVGVTVPNQWYFQYFRDSDTSFWSLTASTSGYRFAYQYGTGLWQHTGESGGFNPLGHGGMNCWFVGDGQLHDLYNGYSYQWMGLNDGQWTVTAGGAHAYWYDYDGGRWWQWVGGEYVLVGGPGAGTNLYNPGES